LSLGSGQPAISARTIASGSMRRGFMA
jgi:hypothetical protein